MDRKLGLQISLRPVPDTCESPRLGYKKPSVMSGDMWAELLFTPLIQSQIFRDSLLVLLPLSHRSRTITWLQHQLSTTDVRIKTASNYSTEMSSARPLMFPHLVHVLLCNFHGHPAAKLLLPPTQPEAQLEHKYSLSTTSYHPSFLVKIV
jgi:hypothetical protein